MADKSIEMPTGRREPFRQRALLVAGISGFVALFQWMYENYLYPNWDYFGFHYEVPPWPYLVLAWILSVTPSLWMPMELRRPSQLTYWVLYIAVIIPSMFVPLYAGLNPPHEVSLLMLALFAGFAMAGGSYLAPLIRFSQVQSSGGLFWKSVVCLAAGLSLWLVVVFRHNLQIVSFSSVYDVRDVASDLAFGTQVNMAFMMLTGAINPFLMGCGLYYKRSWLFLAGVAGQLLVYAVGGTKGSILSILFISTFAFLFKVRRIAFGLKMTYGALALLGALCVSYALSGFEPGPLHTIVLFVVLMRTLSINGLVTAQYYDFFQQNPLTYYSHIKVVNWVVHYPYQYPVGQEIGLAYSGTTGLDATANFFATDGIGGLGLPGILLMSVFCAGVFWILDSAAQKHDPRLAALVTTYAAYNIANISIFTSLLSGGLALLMVMLYVMPAQKGLLFTSSSDGAIAWGLS